MLLRLALNPNANTSIEIFSKQYQQSLLVPIVDFIDVFFRLIRNMAYRTV